MLVGDLVRSFFLTKFRFAAPPWSHREGALRAPSQTRRLRQRNALVGKARRAPARKLTRARRGGFCTTRFVEHRKDTTLKFVNRLQSHLQNHRQHHNRLEPRSQVEHFGWVRTHASHAPACNAGPLVLDMDKHCASRFRI